MSVTDSMIGTVRNGRVMVLANQSRLEEDDDQPATVTKPSVGRTNAFVFVHIDRDDNKDDLGLDSASFYWSEHVEEFSYRDVFLFQKFTDDKFDATYAVETRLRQRKSADTLEDLKGASLTIVLYKLQNEEGHGTGWARDLHFARVTTAPAIMVTGEPFKLKSQFIELIRKN